MLLLGIGLLWGGGQAAYTWWTNREPLKMSLVQYIRERPKQTWVEISGCQVNLLEASVSKGMGVVLNEAFLPVVPEGATDENVPVHILLATDDPAILNRLNRMEDLADDPAALMTYMAKNSEDLIIKRPISGLVQFGIELKSDERRKLAQLDTRLVEDFVIIDDGKAPSGAQAFGTLLGGLVILGVFGAMTVLGTKDSPPSA